MFRRKPKTTFEQLPESAQQLVLHFNAEWNSQKVAEKWAIDIWEKHKDFYRRDGGLSLYTLHLIRHLIDNKVCLHLKPQDQLIWFKRMWNDYQPSMSVLYNSLSKYIQFPHYLIPWINKWLEKTIFEKGFQPNWDSLTYGEVYKNSLTDSGLRTKLFTALRDDYLLYLLWASMWEGKTNYDLIISLLSQFIYITSSKFQNTTEVQHLLEEIIVEDIGEVKQGFLEFLATCY